MEYRSLGNTGIQVSRLCLGTMTFGEQNTESDAHGQLDRALDSGVNFIDTAEMYPVPPKAETQGSTERYIGSWFKQRGKRDDLVLATKVAGPNRQMTHLRGGPRLNVEHITRALEDSLKRLNTDYVDLYQLHWPERQANFFGKLGYTAQPDDEAIELEETLTALKTLVDSGKVRAIGLSNETPWGTMKCLQLADQLGLPRIASIQNPYNLLNRSYEVGLAEVSYRENTGLLAYSPLAFGFLTGKYLGGQKPKNARLTLFERFQRYNSPLAEEATWAYVDIARKHDLDPAQMALAFVNSRPFLTSNIIGATSIAQLNDNLASESLTLSQDVLDEIEAVHKRIPNPCP